MAQTIVLEKPRQKVCMRSYRIYYWSLYYSRETYRAMWSIWKVLEKSFLSEFTRRVKITVEECMDRFGTTTLPILETEVRVLVGKKQILDFLSNIIEVESTVE